MTGRPAAALFLVSAVACAQHPRLTSEAEKPRFIIHRPAMGCMFRIALYDANESSVAEVEREISQILDSTETALSIWNPGSEVSRLNATAADGPVTVSDLLWEAVARSIEISKHTKGAFDVTIGPIIDAYGLRTATPHAPSVSALATAREAVGYQHLQMDPRARTIAFDRAGVAIDLDGIDKGIAVDRIGAILRAHGIRDAIIDAGGSTIASLGPPPPKPPRTIAIEDDQQSEVATLDLRDAALSTSGNWQRIADAPNATFGHIFDPRTGEPIAQTLLSATAVASSAADSDALAKAFLILPQDDIAPVLANFQTSRALVLRRDPANPKHVSAIAIQP